MKGCSKSMWHYGLWSGFILKHTSKNYLASFEILSGNLGGASVCFKIPSIVLGSFPYSDHGGLPYNSSIAKQPKLHISAAKEYPSYLIISGAIQ